MARRSVSRMRMVTKMMSRRGPLRGCWVILSASALACAADAQGDDAGGELPGEPVTLSVQRTAAHLRALQAVADRNGGTRTSGTDGYEESVEYVAGQLEHWGYTVSRQPFEFPFFQELSPPLLEQLSPTAIEYTPDDPAGVYGFTYSASGDVTGVVQGVDLALPPPAEVNSTTSGCEAEDFATFVPGNVALVQRGTCSFADKAANAEAAGASAVIVFNEGQAGRTEAIGGTLFEPGLTIPVVGVSFDTGAALAGSPGASVHIALSNLSEVRTTENLVADTPCGNVEQTIVVGAHLDSVPEGPGINDNGSGTAVVLEVARQLASRGRQRQDCSIENRVRFAFWGAEEYGALGSEHYVSSLAPEELAQIALNLNFDMLGSPNFVRFIYDGDASETPVAGPPGSEQIEAVFADFFAARGLATAVTALDGRSDYAAFMVAGIPVGGLFSGAEGIKTEEQAALFGGTAGEPLDPCYHAACDTLGNVSEQALAELGGAALHAVTLFASRVEPLVRAPEPSISADPVAALPLRRAEVHAAGHPLPR
jgi:Zn-dependent M28 family amino/carboxypeptidase